MTDQTERQAAMLLAVAHHLTDYPDVSPVNVLSDDRLQVRTTADPARALVQWADSLIDPTVTVHKVWSDTDQADRAFVYVAGGVQSLSLDVWDHVPGLVDALEFEDHGSVSLSLDGLRTYAETGVMPGALAEVSA